MEQAAKKTKKRMTGEARRTQIVRVATALFSKNGFKGTTTREIARKARISEAVIFRHFKKKEDLYKAIIDACCNDSFGRSRLIGTLTGKEGIEVFTETAKYLIALNKGEPSFMRLLLFSALEKHDLSEMFMKTRGLELIEFMEERISELIKKGVLRKVDPKLAARAFMGMVLHYSLSQEIYGLKKYFKTPDDRVIEGFVDLFLEGIKKG